MASKHPEELVNLLASKLPTGLNREWAIELLDTIEEAGYFLARFITDEQEA